jgi:hypothetical protein
VTHVVSKSLIPIVFMTNPVIYRRERGDKAFGGFNPARFSAQFTTGVKTPKTGKLLRPGDKSPG